MLDISLYSNDSFFLAELRRDLSAKLERTMQGACRFQSLSLLQTSLYDRLDSPPDLCVVDLRDDPEEAMAFVRRLRRNAGTEIMVIASAPDWAMAAYDADVMSYLLWPPDVSRMAELVLRRFAQRFQPQPLQFSFRTASGTQVLAAEHIIYVEYSDHRLLIYTDSGKRFSTTAMRLSFGKATEQLLADPRFVRTHASFLINIMHVSSFGQYTVTMDTGVTVPISHAKKAEVNGRFRRFFGREETAADSVKLAIRN